jgi:predicted esterase
MNKEDSIGKKKMSVVLFFHGYGQNGKFLCEKRKLSRIKNKLEEIGYRCIFVDGKYKSQYIENGCINPKSWYEQGVDIEKDIDELLEDFSPFNLILIGFSQGSVYIDAILRHYFAYKDKYKCYIKKAIFCSGHINDTIHKSIPSVPSLHI